VLVLSLSAAFACAGFLPYNVRPRRPAAAFLGDSGSQSLGFLLGAIALASSWKVAAPSLATILLPVLVLAIPILDTALVTVVRLLEGRPVYAGGRDHTSHRLVYRGLSERRALVLLAVIAAALGATSLAYNAADNSAVTVAGVLVTFVVLVQLAGFLGEPEPSGAEPSASRLRRTFELHRGRLVEMLVDFALITASFAAAYLLRFEGSGPPNQRHLFLSALPVLLAARYAVFILLGLYSSVWRPLSRHLADDELRDLFAQRVRDRRHSLHAARRRLPARPARDRATARRAGQPRAQAEDADRRRRPRRP
jgi:UDP-GlcNAc:undecaprenyl-phosphate GlcNAc-1-phosphate transferase